MFDGRTQEARMHDQRSVSSEVHLHDHRSVSIGVDPQLYAQTVSQAQQLLNESETRASHFEGLSKELHAEANRQIQELKLMVAQLHQACMDRDRANQDLGGQARQLTASFDSTREQLRIQALPLNEQLDSAKAEESNRFRNMIGHKHAEIHSSFDA